MAKILLSKFRESVLSVLPVTAIILVIALTPLASLTVTETVAFCLSAVGLIIGMSLFNLGADLAMTPMGGHVGTGLTKSKKLGVLLSVCFVMGLLITIAEPDLTVFAEQVKTIMPLGGSAGK